MANKKLSKEERRRASTGVSGELSWLIFVYTRQEYARNMQWWIETDLSSLTPDGSGGYEAKQARDTTDFNAGKSAGNSWLHNAKDVMCIRMRLAWSITGVCKM